MNSWIRMVNSMKDKPRVVRSHDVTLDSEYTEWIHDIKEQYRNTQIKAAVKVNSEQLIFNWILGRELVLMRAEEKWGAGIVEQVSLDLRNEFPASKGFSTTNLWNMKKWYLFYSADMEKLHQLGGELPAGLVLKNAEQMAVTSIEKLHQLGGETEFPVIFGFVPWRHHVEIITKCKSIEELYFTLNRQLKRAGGVML